MFEKISPVSGGRATDRASASGAAMRSERPSSVSDRTGDAARMDVVDGTESGNTKPGRDAVLNLNLLDDVVTEF
jgi:hypothetical protein